MASINNIFCASNPARLNEALWTLIRQDAAQMDECVIFLPSRRAVRSVSKMLVEKIGHAIVLPALIPLGEGADDLDDAPQSDEADVLSNQERVVVLAKILSVYPAIRNMTSALPIARDLVRMQDYLENEGIDSQNINWTDLVDEKYATHFQQKAEILDIIKTVFPNQMTTTKKRNADIRAWQNQLSGKRRVIVCGSTASVPATADLMAYVASMPNGMILLSGKIDGEIEDLSRDTNPYNSEYKFLCRIGAAIADVQVIDVGKSSIDFFNAAFGNLGSSAGKSGGFLIECAREAEEAECAAEIAARSLADSKSVLIITPDAAGNQRLAESLKRRNLRADFSGGASGAMTDAGRALLNLFDGWIEERLNIFDERYRQNDFNLFETLLQIVEEIQDDLIPNFDTDSPDTIAVWDAVRQLSDALARNGIQLGTSGARAFIADCLSGVSVRPVMSGDTKICVLGTIESRMQTADVIILTGLNEGMFPAQGYENSWLPKYMAQKIGLPSGDRKISLMALDFMNLSCGAEVYWLRSRTSGGSGTIESRFLSRVTVAQRGIDTSRADDVLSAVRACDIVPFAPLDYSAPRPPADKTDVYVTELDWLIHNPYTFYARHILRLYPKDDYWHEPDARDFGNLVHGVLEDAQSMNAAEIVAEMDRRARALLPDQSILFYFWHKRFLEIAPLAQQMLIQSAGGATEIHGHVRIAGRTVRAKADRVWDGVVLDIKTGEAPSKSQLEQGNMPQLPLEAFILQNGGFDGFRSPKNETPVLKFLRLQNNNVAMIEYADSTAAAMIDASVQKVSELFGRYSNDYEPYEYRETTDQKYKTYDDLARVDD